MKKQLFTFMLILISVAGLMATGHYPNSNIGYHDGNHNHPYTVNPNGRQSSLHLDMAHSDIPANAQADVYPLFTFDTSGKNVYLVYTKDGSVPTKTNGFRASCTFSKYNDPDRWWTVSIPAINTVGTTVKYIIYISDSSIENAWGRIGVNGYVTNWTEGDDPGFSYVTQAVLPVTLQNFTGKAAKGESHLNWITSSETNNERFDIEYSVDAKLWTKIGSVKGNGSTMISHNYSFTHQTPVDGQNYYRLKQVDFDGQSVYSEVIAVLNNRLDVTINLFPNPGTNILNIKGDENMIGTQLLLLDISGKEVFRQTVRGTQIEIPISSFNNGLYLIRLIDSNRRTITSQFFEKI